MYSHTHTYMYTYTTKNISPGYLSNMVNVKTYRRIIGDEIGKVDGSQIGK